MWAHYTECHTGLVIGFDGRENLLESLSPHRRIAPVVYGDERPSKPTYDDLTDAEVLLTKSREWAFEQERRLIDSLYSADPEATDTDEIRWSFRIRPESVREVILGCRVEAALEHEARMGSKPGTICARDAAEDSRERTSLCLRFRGQLPRRLAAHDTMSHSGRRQPGEPLLGDSAVHSRSE